MTYSIIAKEPAMMNGVNNTNEDELVIDYDSMKVLPWGSCKQDHYPPLSPEING